MKKLLPLVCLFGAVGYADEMLPEPQLLQTEVEFGREPVVAFRPRRNAGIAVGLSALLPGLGHAYLGEYRTACGLLGSSSLYVGMMLLHPHNRSLWTANISLLSCNWFYGIYASYRDARVFNGVDSYCYKMPMESLSDLAMAPFQWKVLKKREVWLALLADLGLAVGLQYFLQAKNEGFSVGRSVGGAVKPFTAFPIGIGEEAFFRGFLQSYAGENVGPWGGIAISSAAFGAAHIPNALSYYGEDRRDYYSAVLPFITLTGIYYGWVSYKNASLKEVVALHCWYDFAIFMASYAASRSVGWGLPSFAFSIPF